jgi:hypothetical protein
MIWALSHRADQESRVIADRHYSRGKPGTQQFVSTGSCLVMRAVGGLALWVTLWPRAEFVKHAWPGAWVCSLFRNEGDGRASDMIRQAVAATRHHYGEPPALGMITFVNPDRIQSEIPGYCFRRAGFRRVGETQKGLIALQLAPHRMPAPEPCWGMPLVRLADSTPEGDRPC